ncbi:hypothetical protein M413DRAFT_448010 [Hebeloma cylindrosporum]|uniref:Uncharacterized protein n=1 Tax=Hebeloma cylindrosporum TaxID=76867 RepID=A0A0C3BNN9_HEBCY|nr:hypothetical protein M413DRAFT_448010 [Hebeloma cylindrosporum h7]
MMQPEYLPPGSRTRNVDSFNSRNETISNVSNDNSMEHGIPTRRKRKRRPALRREDDDEDEDEDARPQRSAARGPASNPHFPFNQRPAYGPSAFSTMSANFAPGQVQGMGDAMQNTFDTLMRQAFEQTVPEREEEDSVSEEESTEEEEEEAQDPRMTTPTNGMSNLSLDEDRPAYSRVKSDPQNPYPHPTGTASSPNQEPARSESLPVLPEHMRQPFAMPPNRIAATSGPYARYAPASIPPWNGHHGQQSTAPATPEPQPSIPSAPPGPAPGAYAAPQGEAPNGAYASARMAPPPPPPPPAPRRPGPVFNTIHGDYTKVDQTVHSTNIGSGNTHNMVIQDSFNDNSAKSYAPPAPKARKQGRLRSMFH